MSIEKTVTVFILFGLANVLFLLASYKHIQKGLIKKYADRNFDLKKRDTWLNYFNYINRCLNEKNNVSGHQLRLFIDILKKNWLDYSQNGKIIACDNDKQTKMIEKLASCKQKAV